MYVTRQDAWTEDEDIILAETVLRYIREGKTQLEAFKVVAKQLSRTSAACGFRWNASLRKKYHDAISLAKEERKKKGQQDILKKSDVDRNEDPIDTAISLLEKMKSQYETVQETNYRFNKEKLLYELEKKNNFLEDQLSRYEKAWEEMGKLWEWAKERKQS